MHVEKVAVSSLVFDPANARKHGAKNLEAIKGSLTRFGQQKPIVVDEKGVVLAGNGTLAAAKELGWTDIEVHRTTLTGSDKTAFAIADNRTGELAEWDHDALAMSLKQLMDDDIDPIGFSPEDIAKLMPEIGEVELPDINTEDEKSLQQMTFIFHTDQHAAVSEAVSVSKKDCGEYPGNTNSNANALHRICLEWMAQKA